MQPELIIFLLMVGSFMLSCFAFKLSAGIGMVIAAIVGALASGRQRVYPPVPVRRIQPSGLRVCRCKGVSV